MQPPRKRQSRFRFPAGARSLSSFGRAPTWYVGGGWFEPSREHQAPVAQRQRQHAQTVLSASSNLARRTNLRALRALRLGKPARARRPRAEARRAQADATISTITLSRALSSEAERGSYKAQVGISKFSARTKTHP